MVPLLFTFDMGSELQKPLSIAMISAMLIGTAVSLFVIPLIYWFIYRKHDIKKLKVENWKLWTGNSFIDMSSRC